MSGMMDMLIGCAGQGGGGGYGGTLGGMNWTNVFDTGSGTTNNQTITGITGSVVIGATLTGAGTLVSTGLVTFPGTESFNNGDLLAWTVNNRSTATVSGTVTVTNQTAGGTTIDTFTYTVLRDT